MALPLELVLTDAERQELEYVRDHDRRPYMRERAAGLIKIAEGMSARQVALHGLLKRRGEDAIYSWYHRYKAQRIQGLEIRPGRGRKPAFSPSRS